MQKADWDADWTRVRVPLDPQQNYNFLTMETNENKRFKKFMADAKYEVNEKKKGVT